MGDAGDRQGSDEAQIQILEAVLIAMVMLGAIGFVLTFSLPTSESEPMRAGLATKSRDALAVMNEYPLEDTRYGDNLLSYAISRALEDDTDPLVGRLTNLLPPATAFNVYLSNGYKTWAVYETGEPDGETVTATQLLEPSWSYTYVSRDASAYRDDTMGVYAMPIYKSNPVNDGGVFVRVEAELELDGHAWPVRSYYTTVQGARQADGNWIGSSVYGADSLQNPKPYYYRVGGADNKVYVVVEATEGSTIPAGTEIVVRVPPGQEASYVVSEDVPDLDGVPNQNGAWILDPDEDTVDPLTGGRLVARLENPLVNGKVVFEFTSKFTSNRPYDFYVLDVTLGGGTQRYGKAEIVLQDQESAAFTGGDYLDVYATVPKPMGYAGSTQWSVVITNPPMQNNLLSDVFLKKLTIESVDGDPIFGGVATTRAPDAAVFTVQDGGTKLVWEPANAWKALALPRARAVEFVLSVDANQIATRDDSRDYLTVPVVVNDGTRRHEQQLTRQVEPGLYFGQVPPDAGIDGYGFETAVGTWPIDADAHWNGRTLEGAWTYDVDTLAFKDLFSTVALDVEKRHVPVGTRATMDVNVENLVTELLFRGFNVETHTRIYPPWSMTTHEAIYEKLSLHDPAVRRDVTAVVAKDMTGDGILDLVVGTNEGKLTGFDVGRKGAVISGATWVTEDQPVTSIATFDPPDFDPYDGFSPLLPPFPGAHDPPAIVFGTGADTARATVYVLDEDFELVNDPEAFYEGAVSISDTAAGFDLDADNYLDYLVGGVTGTNSAFDGSTTGEQEFPAGAWPKEYNFRSSLVNWGYTGPGKVPTAVVTTGVDANVGVWKTVEQDSSTNEGKLTNAVEELKRVSISLNTDGLVGFDHAGSAVWSFPAGGFRDVETQDLDGDGWTDLVAGAWDGYVYAADGKQATMPWLGSSIATGDAITDADFLDINHGWTIDPDGLLMFTNDGFTSRYYLSDPVLGAPITLAGAYGLDFVDHTRGWVVGDGGVVWKTTDGGVSVAAVTYSVLDGNGLPLATWGSANFRDVSFAADDHGILVGQACTGCLGVSYPLWTADGGLTWNKASASAGSFPSEFHRVYWQGATRAWAVGSDGAVFISETTGIPVPFTHCDADGRCVVKYTFDGTTPAGRSWTSRSPDPATYGTHSFHDVDCVPKGAGEVCWVVGTDGVALYTEDTGATWKAATTGTKATLRGVDFFDEDLGIIVGDDMTVLITRDGGANWLASPKSGPITGHWNAVDMLAADVAYFFGGDLETRAMGSTAGYMSSAVAQTKNILEGDEFSNIYWSNPQIVTAKINPNSRNNEDTNVVYEVSADGTNWEEMEPVNPKTLDIGGKRKYPWTALTNPGTQLRVRWTLSTSLDMTHNTPVARDLAVEYNVSFTCTDLVNGCEAPPLVDCDGTACVATLGEMVEIRSGLDEDPGATTAYWGPTGLGPVEEIRLPRVTKYWTVNLGGRVHDVEVGPDLTSHETGFPDGYREIVVAVGPHEDEADVPSGAWINRVFLLDGRSGITLSSWEPAPFGTFDRAEPLFVRWADVGTPARPKDGVPDVLVGIFDHDDNSILGDSRVQVVDGASFAAKSPVEIDTVARQGKPTALVVADVDTTDGVESDDFILGTSASIANDLPGYVYVFSADDLTPANDWTELLKVSPDARGGYVVHYDVPREALYGPYFVEAEVRWSDAGGTSSAFFTDYFVVTPDTGVMPVNPLYTVHLVTWFEDWHHRPD